MRDHARYWAFLASLPELSPAQVVKMVKAFGSARSAWEAGGREVARAAGLAAAAGERLVRSWTRWHPESLEERVARLGYSILVHGWQGYPEVLVNIEEPPAILYCWGRPEAVGERCVALVGARRADQNALLTAEALARELAEEGVTVISGLARGVDGAAHRGALAGGGPTVAVLGAGLDRLYPPEHAGLARRIADSGGALFSEFPPGTPPLPQNFPWRNRIISGLASGVVVVAAGVKSGALSTAGWAADQGKEVFACPGDVVKDGAAGSNLLLRDGATPVLDASDVLGQLGWPARAGRRPGRDCQVPLTAGAGLSDNEGKVWACLSRQPQPLDRVVRAAGLPVGDVTAALLLLELRGCVRQLPGPSFVRLLTGQYNDVPAGAQD